MNDIINTHRLCAIYLVSYIVSFSAFVIEIVLAIITWITDEKHWRMQLFQSEDHYILHDGEFSLWCCRQSGSLEAKKGFHMNNYCYQSRLLFDFFPPSSIAYKKTVQFPSTANVYLVQCLMHKSEFPLFWLDVNFYFTTKSFTFYNSEVVVKNVLNKEVCWMNFS